VLPQNFPIQLVSAVYSPQLAPRTGVNDCRHARASQTRDSNNVEIAMRDLIRKVSETTGLSYEMSRRTVDEIANHFEGKPASPAQPAAHDSSEGKSARHLSARLLRVQDDERRRIAREIHDGAGQALAALAMNVRRLQSSMVPNEQQAQILSDTHKLLQDATRELRTISYLLHPPLLDEVGLPSALQLYVDGFAKRSGIRTRLELPPDFKRLTSDHEITIFRVVQECLTNIHRHSGSGTAEVRLTRSGHDVRLEVIDHGKGIPVGKRPSHSVAGTMSVGLKGMYERVSHLGGRLVVRSNHRGTTVVAIMPVEQAVAACVGKSAA
jgi:signal transduction histidine kinase